MAWYRAGSVTVTNGSPVVTGAGTAFVANVQAGHAINLPDGRVYEVASVDSNSQLTLGSVYLGGTAGGQGYSVQPNQGFAQSAASRLSEFLSQVSGWVAGALAGRFADGNPSVPGISFAADQDSGLRRFADNGVAIVTGGIDRLACDGSGRIGIGTAAPFPQAKVHVNNNDTSPTYVLIGNANNGVGIGVEASGAASIYGFSGIGLIFGTNLATAPTEFARFDTSGNFLVGSTSGSAHTIFKSGVGVGGAILNIAANTGDYTANFYGTDQSGGNGSATALKLGKSSGTGRSLNAGGSINTGGADYAEYMVKADGCGVIAKGDVCGVDVDGKLTQRWAAAVSFVIKSTDPAYVGGDTWAAHLAARPDEPGAPPVPPTEVKLSPDATDEDRRSAAAVYQAACDGYAVAKTAHDAAAARYLTDLPAWEAQMEAARSVVDRIAFAGQVPVNLAGDCAVGDYLIAAPDGDGIRAIAVSEKDISFDQYRRRLGKVWAIRDGRPWIDVQHG